ncbi:MAG: ethanolamine utilization protein EutN [Spirochaetes bacterium]|nr:MAG: ethanolamine utilization protein EutN [Spirochaetota bacterium]
MVLARVVGTVVSSAKEPRLEGMKLLVLEKINPLNMEGTGSFVIALDSVEAGEGELVFYVSGSSSRQTELTSGKPTDATVIGIVDTLEVGGVSIFQKDRDAT